MNLAQDMLRSVVPRLNTHSLTGGKRPKSILRRNAKPRRPPPLRLAPNPYSNVIISHTPSPHVHFPPSACLITTFVTHSPNSYDRGAISVSPNPLELPARGERIYSPSTGSFVELGSDSPICTPTKSCAVSPPIKEMTDGIDGRLDYSERSPVQLGKALKSYPRSPYPTAALLGARHDMAGGAEEASSRSGRPQRSSTVPTRRKRVPQLLTLGVGAPASPHVSSPLGRTTYGPSTSLSQAFWDAVQLSTDQNHEHEFDSEPEGSPLDIDVPNFAFATMDGNLWSPGIMTRSAQDNHGSDCKSDVAQKERDFSRVKSPDPHDAFADFPSFSAVLSMDGK